MTRETKAIYMKAKFKMAMDMNFRLVDDDGWHKDFIVGAMNYEEGYLRRMCRDFEDIGNGLHIEDIK